MSETPTENNRGLTIKPVHFPPLILVTAGLVWGLSILGAVLEVVIGH